MCVCVCVCVCVFVRGHLEAKACPYQLQLEWSVSKRRQLSQPAHPPQYTHTHTRTHTLILCTNPHITPHLVMKTSSIIPLDRPQGLKADSSLWGLLCVDWPSQIHRVATHTLRNHLMSAYVCVCVSSSSTVCIKSWSARWPVFFQEGR